MKWNFNINQRAIIENQLTLDLVDAAIFDLIKDFSLSDKCKKSIENGKVYYWISWRLIIEQAPIIGLKTRQSVYNRLENLIENGLLERHENNKLLGQSWFSFGLNFDKMVSFSSAIPVNEILQGVNENLQTCKDSVTPPVNSDLHYTSINNKDINNNISIVGATAPEIETTEKPKKSSKATTAKSDNYTAEFEAFWKAYDKVEAGGKKQCFEKWKRLPKETHATIMLYVEWYKKDKPDKQYRKNPITFFNQQCWIDFNPKPERPNTKSNATTIDTRTLFGELA